MKYCTHCGAEIGDDFTYCPKCGKRVSEEVKNDTPKQQTENTNQNNPLPTVMPPKSSTASVLFVFDILSGVFFLVGFIIFAIGGYKEYMFRSSYNLEELTKAGIDLLRKSSAYSDSITLLTIGGVCAGVSLVFGLIMIPFLRALHRNDKN